MLLTLEVILESFNFGKWVFGVTLFYSLFVRLDLLIIARFVSFRDRESTRLQHRLLWYCLFTGALSGIFLPKSMEAVTSKAKMSDYFHEITIPLVLVLAFIIALFFVSVYYEHLFWEGI